MSTQLHADISEETVRRIAEEHDEPDWLLETRLAALEALDDLAYPSVIETPGRTWTDLEALDFDALVDPFDQSEAKELEVPGDVGVEALPFHEALATDAAPVREHFGSIVDPQENRLTALSTALFTTGTVVYVPEGVDAEDVTIRTTMEGRSLFNYTLVVTEESSSVTLLERGTTAGDSGAQSDAVASEGATSDGHRYYSGIVEVAAGENSNVQYGAMQNFDRETYNYTLKRGVADTYANVEWIEGNLGSGLTKTGVETRLAGEGSETRIVGAFFGDGQQHFDLDSRVWHEAEHTTADLVTRGVVDDEARSVYEGVQDVGSGAWDTSSYQRENTLMLSDVSEADASPKLIINNHDTEASHSATVGQVDREDLFYMVSRGMGERQARNLLVEGFFVPVLEEVAVDELREDIQTLVAERLRA